MLCPGSSTETIPCIFLVAVTTGGRSVSAGSSVEGQTLVIIVEGARVGSVVLVSSAAPALHARWVLQLLDEGEGEADEDGAENEDDKEPVCKGQQR